MEKLNMREEKEIIVTWSRASTIIPTMIGHTIAIHNGKKHLPLFLYNRSYGRSQIGRIRAYSDFRETCKKRQ
nr:ribosomal protein S19 [Attalea sp. N_XM174]WGM68820.1 ribosomal protein S19 [Attalea sp. N_XM174]